MLTNFFKLRILFAWLSISSLASCDVNGIAPLGALSDIEDAIEYIEFIDPSGKVLIWPTLRRNVQIIAAGEHKSHIAKILERDRYFEYQLKGNRTKNFFVIDTEHTKNLSEIEVNDGHKKKIAKYLKENQKACGSFVFADLDTWIYMSVIHFNFSLAAEDFSLAECIMRAANTVNISQINGMRHIEGDLISVSGKYSAIKAIYYCSALGKSSESNAPRTNGGLTAFPSLDCAKNQLRKMLDMGGEIE